MDHDGPDRERDSGWSAGLGILVAVMFASAVVLFVLSAQNLGWL